ncbi:unnamed protein product [Penicillium egyptiacum]|uniref:Zn(2)-C6 fungal-type domain-containing protein n=1 Tax=Penicillium egyptiacum TaxID=1303716 RepID=A0A9W4KJ80_9EURO|nr:unnamed protein product [Penicillium egyptiacum]
MKVKQKSVCQNCRNRKLGCDGKRPGCSQCVLSGHTCDGYRTEWKFISHTPMSSSTSEQHNQARIVQKEGQETVLGADRQEDSPTGPIPLQVYLNPLIVCNFTELITKSYVPQNERVSQMCNSDYIEPRICGSWVEVLPSLPCLNTPSLVLPRAVTALATSLLSQPSKSDITRSQTYDVAIHTLRQSFGLKRRSLSIEQIPAIMCLTLVELMIPDSVAAILSHVQAVGMLLQAHGPSMCSSGLLHKLFVGFRPLLAFRSRQPTFLASKPWIDTPFSHFCPSLMQSLFNEAVILPALLHQSDCVLGSPAQCHLSDINKIPGSFINVLIRLDEWEMELQKGDQPCYWRCGYVSQVESRTTDDTRSLPFWYPNVTMANVFTHLWAFRIVCLSELKRFKTHFPGSDQEQPVWTGQFDKNDDHIQDQLIVLAKNISLSMVYLLQDEMRLFGPASTIFPLQMAYQAYKSLGSRHQVDIAYLEGIIDQLDEKGLKSARALVFDN